VLYGAEILFSAGRQSRMTRTKASNSKMSSAGTDVDMSSDDARSVRSVKSAMSVDDDPTTPPRKGYVT
jgi:hypothetical protein